MRIKEINVWVNAQDNLENNFKNTSIHWTLEDAKHFQEKGDVILQGKLTVELPEPKIEITPSQLFEAMNNVDSTLSFVDYNKRLNERLFGENYDK